MKDNKVNKELEEKKESSDKEKVKIDNDPFYAIRGLFKNFDKFMDSDSKTSFGNFHKKKE